MDQTNKRTNIMDRARLSISLKRIRAEFITYQTYITPLLLILATFIGVFLVRFFPNLSIPLLLIGTGILVFWATKFFVYESTIKTIMLSSSYLLQIDTQRVFGKKLTAMPMLYANDTMALSAMLLNRKRVVLIFFLLLLTYIINYISLLVI